MRCLVATRVANRFLWASGVGFVGQTMAIYVVGIQIEIVPLVLLPGTSMFYVLVRLALGSTRSGPGAGARCRLVLCGGKLVSFIRVRRAVAHDLSRSCELRTLETRIVCGHHRAWAPSSKRADLVSSACLLLAAWSMDGFRWDSGSTASYPEMLEVSPLWAWHSLLL